MGLVVFLQCGKGLLFTLRFMLTPTHPPCLLLLPFSCPELFVHMNIRWFLNQCVSNIRWFRTSVCQISDGFVPACVKYQMVLDQCVSNITKMRLSNKLNLYRMISQTLILVRFIYLELRISLSPNLSFTIMLFTQNLKLTHL